MAVTGMTAGTAVAGLMAGDVAGDVAEEMWRKRRFLRVRAIPALLFPFWFSPHPTGSPTCTVPGLHSNYRFVCVPTCLFIVISEPNHDLASLARRHRIVLMFPLPHYLDNRICMFIVISEASEAST